MRIEHDSPSTFLIKHIFPGDSFEKIIIEVDEVFNGNKPFLEIGIKGNPNKYFPAHEIDLQHIDTYITDVNESVESQIDLFVTYFSDDSNMGKASIYIE
jgi:hypothetical protein